MSTMKRGHEAAGLGLPAHFGLALLQHCAEFLSCPPPGLGTALCATECWKYITYFYILQGHTGERLP